MEPETIENIIYCQKSINRPRVGCVPIPAMESDYLPVGVHSCTFEEIKQTFGTNDRRMELLDKLSTYIEEIKGMGWKGWIIVNGSFVTKNEDPGDIDVILVFDGDYSILAPVTPVEGKFLNQEYIKDTFEVHFWPAFYDNDTEK